MVPWVIYIGFGMVIFLTQISTIPREYYEAAQLDGAREARLAELGKRTPAGVDSCGRRVVGID